jgi:hypothetical protein
VAPSKTVAPLDPDQFLPDRRDYPLSGRNRLYVIRALAVGDPKPAALARQFGVQRNAITMFQQRNRRAIDEVRKAVDDEFAGLWVARKEARLAEYEWMIDILGEAIEANYDADMIRVRAGLLKNVSEELGQLPPRTQVVSARVVHVVEGFSSTELDGYLT